MNKADLDKIRFHIRKIAETIDFKRFPIESLILDFEWSEEEFEIVEKIFEDYYSIFEEKKTFSATKFENEFKGKLNLTYQSVKQVVLAFYEKGIAAEICIEFAKQKRSTELDRILKKEKIPLK